MIYRRLFIFGAVAALLLSGGCVELPGPGQNRLPASQFVLVEHGISTEAEIVGDNDPYNASAYNYLGYRTYNASTNLSLSTQLGWFPEINDSLKVFFSNVEIVGPEGCHGSSADNYGVHDLPFELGNFTVLGVDGQGAVLLSYKGKQMMLKAGEKYETITNTTELIESDGAQGAPVLINISVSDRIRNFGTYNKAEFSS